MSRKATLLIQPSLPMFFLRCFLCRRCGLSAVHRLRCRYNNDLCRLYRPGHYAQRPLAGMGTRRSELRQPTPGHRAKPQRAQLRVGLRPVAQPGIQRPPGCERPAQQLLYPKLRCARPVRIRKGRDRPGCGRSFSNRRRRHGHRRRRHLLSHLLRRADVQRRPRRGQRRPCKAQRRGHQQLALALGWTLCCRSVDAAAVDPWPARVQRRRSLGGRAPVRTQGVGTRGMDRVCGRQPAPDGHAPDAEVVVHGGNLDSLVQGAGPARQPCQGTAAPAFRHPTARAGLRGPHPLRQRPLPKRAPPPLLLRPPPFQLQPHQSNWTRWRPNCKPRGWKTSGSASCPMARSLCAPTMPATTGTPPTRWALRLGPLLAPWATALSPTA